MTLTDDFSSWWDLSKYKDSDIPAKKFGDVAIRVKHASNYGWPGPEEEVKYWVELENGWAVGVITPRKGEATFPVYEINV